MSVDAEPLFHDPYAACLLAEETFAGPVGDDDVGYYELATSFIDDKIMEVVKADGEALVRQVRIVSTLFISKSCSGKLETLSLPFSRGDFH